MRYEFRDSAVVILVDMEADVGCSREIATSIHDGRRLSQADEIITKAVVFNADNSFVGNDRFGGSAGYGWDWAPVLVLFDEVGAVSGAARLGNGPPLIQQAGLQVMEIQDYG